MADYKDLPENQRLYELESDRWANDFSYPAESRPFFDNTLTDLPEDIAGSLAETRPKFFDTLEDIPEEDPNDPLNQQLAENKAAQEKINKWLSTFHGAEPESVSNLRRQVDTGKISAHDYFAMTGRIYSGGTGDTASRDARGNITGFTSPDGSGTALGGPSGTPGLDRFHALNPDAKTGEAFAFKSLTPLPASVVAKVTPTTPTPAAPITSIFADRKTQTPYGPVWQSPAFGLWSVPASLPSALLV